MTRHALLRRFVALGLLTAVLTGCADRGATSTTPHPAAGAPTTVAPPTPPPPVQRPDPVVVTPSGPRPAKVTLTWAHTTATVAPVANTPTGGLEVPDDVDVAGWWSPGARPTDPAGTTVLVGHVDSAAQGIGAFHALWRAHPGDQVTTTDAKGGRQRWTVTTSRTYPKDQVPFVDLFTTIGPRRLALITCDGDFRSGHYTNNRVVLATPDP